MTGRVDWESIDTVIFDVDGTLYHQRPLRLLMAWRLLVHGLTRREGWRVLRAVQAFRACREELADLEAEDIGVQQYARPAERLGESSRFVAEVARAWIDTKPLDVLARYRRAGAAELFAALSASGRTIGVFSDYPAAAKLAALGLKADLVASATDPEIDRLKPHPAGLAWLLERTGTGPERCLVIGDRPERDGAAARRLGISFVHVGRARDPDCPACLTFRDPLFAPVLGGKVLGGEAACRRSRQAARSQTP